MAGFQLFPHKTDVEGNFLRLSKDKMKNLFSKKKTIEMALRPSMA